MATLGTMAAVLLYFWADPCRIARSWVRSLVHRQSGGERDAGLGRYLIVATIPIAVFGLVFSNQIESGARDLHVASALIAFGLLLDVCRPAGDESKVPRRGEHRDGVVIGATLLAMAVAFVVDYASIAWLLRWLTTHSTSIFVVYRLALGGMLWVFLALGALHPL